jgi:hypothetical protein
MSDEPAFELKLSKLFILEMENGKRVQVTIPQGSLVRMCQLLKPKRLSDPEDGETMTYVEIDFYDIKTMRSCLYQLQGG